MKTRRIVWLLVVLFVGAALTALPATAQDIPALPLTATFTSSNGSLSFQHPEGWVTGENGPGVMLATHEPFLPPGTPLESGEFRADIFAGPINRLTRLDVTASLDDVMSLATQFDTTENCEAFSTPVAFTIDGHASLQSVQVCADLEFMLLIVELDAGTIGIIGAMTPVGAMSDFASTILAIGGTMAYTVPPAQTDITNTKADASAPLVIDTSAIELGQSYEAESGFMTFRFPDDWSVFEDSSGQLPLIVTPLENPAGMELLSPGDSLAIIIYSDIATYLGQNQPSDEHERALATLEAVVTASGGPADNLFPLTVGERAGAGMEVTTPEGDNGVYLLPVDGDFFALVSVYAPVGELAESAPIYQAILTTIAFDLPTSNETTVPENVVEAPPQVVVPPETLAQAVPFSLDFSETFTSGDGSLQFEYPAGWTIVPSSSQLILTNVSELSFVAGEAGFEVAPGHFRVVIGLASKAEKTLEDLWAESSDTIGVGDGVSFSAGDHEAIRGPINIHLMSGTLAVVDLNPESAAIITVYHSPENMSEVDELLPTLIESMQYQ